jgi:hypothetical protein
MSEPSLALQAQAISARAEGPSAYRLLSNSCSDRATAQQNHSGNACEQSEANQRCDVEAR